MAFVNLVNAALSESPLQQHLAETFLSQTCSHPRYVIGRNDEAASVLKRIPVDGIIDDYTKDMEWHGVPIYPLKSVPKDAIVLNCSTSISPVAVIDNLTAAGLGLILNYSDILTVADANLPLPWFVKQQRDDWAAHASGWATLHECLEDQESKQTLLDVLRFRLTANPIYMRAYKVRLKDQYFEEFMQYRHETFVDAGGFDGDTTETFCQRYPDYEHVYLFEPSPRNIAAARQRLAPNDRIQFIQLGLSDVSGTLYFNSDAGSASSVSSSGSEKIKVVTLDEAVHEKVSFIKMDLEGWELKALSGCTKHILSDKPKLAISVYHAAADFRLVPEFILRLNDQYRVYLRHYTQGWSETVMFFLPR